MGIAAPAVETVDAGVETESESEAAEPESDPEDAVPDPAPVEAEAEAVKVAWPGVECVLKAPVSLALRIVE